MVSKIAMCLGFYFAGIEGGFILANYPGGSWFLFVAALAFGYYGVVKSRKWVAA